MEIKQTEPDQYIINDKVFEKFIDSSIIAEYVQSIADRINKDYEGKTPVFLVVLKGAVFFASDLMKKITLNCELDVISAKSYGQSMISSGDVLLNPNNLDLSGRDIIIVEDIADNGFTLKKLTEFIQMMSPASLEIAVIFSKSEQRKVHLDIKYLGIEIPSAFVVGYGLDYAEKGRNLPSLYKLLR